MKKDDHRRATQPLCVVSAAFRRWLDHRHCFFSSEGPLRLLSQPSATSSSCATPISPAHRSFGLSGPCCNCISWTMSKISRWWRLRLRCPRWPATRASEAVMGAFVNNLRRGIAVRAAESSPEWASAAARSGRRCTSSCVGLARKGPGTSFAGHFQRSAECGFRCTLTRLAASSVLQGTASRAGGRLLSCATPAPSRPLAWKRWPRALARRPHAQLRRAALEAVCRPLRKFPKLPPT